MPRRRACKAGTYHPLPLPHAGAQRRTLGGDGTHLDMAAVMAAPREIGPGSAFLDAAARRSFVFRCSAVFRSSIALILRPNSTKVCSFTSCCKASCSFSCAWGSSSPNGTRLLILEAGASLMAATAEREAPLRRVLQQTSAAGDSLGRIGARALASTTPRSRSLPGSRSLPVINHQRHRDVLSRVIISPNRRGDARRLCRVRTCFIP